MNGDTAPCSSKEAGAKASLGNFQFAEMNIKHRGDPTRTLDLVRRAIRMGYDAVVINTDIGEFKMATAIKNDAYTESGAPPQKKRKKSKLVGKADDLGRSLGDFIPDPFLVDTARLDLSSLEAAGKKFRQFRLTATISDTLSFHRFQQHPKLRLYNVIAMRIADEQFLATFQRKGDLIDIVSIDSAEAEVVPWLFKQKLVQACSAAGLSFELVYSGALTSVENRRQFFTNARSLMEITRGGRGVIFSSGAEDIISIRAPYDVCNLCTLFGLNHKEGRKFISANARALLLRSQARKTVRGTIHESALNPNAVPSANGATAERVLGQLATIPEFHKQLAQPEQAEKNDSATTLLATVA